MNYLAAELMRYQLHVIARECHKDLLDIRPKQSFLGKDRFGCTRDDNRSRAAGY